MSTIAFISFQSYTKNSRDTNRLATLKNIDEGLNLYEANSSKFPLPEEIYGTGVINDKVLNYAGYIGEGNARILNFSKTPLDPFYDTKYNYGVSYDYKYYQIASIMEGNEISLFINKAFAEYHNITKVIGNYIGLISYNDNGKIIANIPSLIFSSTGTIDIGSNDPYFIVNNGENLPNVFKEKFQIKNTPKNEALSKIGSKATDINVENVSNITKDNWDEYKSVLKDKFGLKEKDIGEAIFGKQEYNTQINKNDDISYPFCILGNGSSTGSIVGECSL